MAAFIIFHSTIKDADKFKMYASAVPATLVQYAGEVVLKGKMSQVFSGELAFRNVGIIRFPSLRSAQDWYSSGSYQKLLKVRKEAADMLVALFEDPQ